MINFNLNRRDMGAEQRLCLGKASLRRVKQSQTTNNGSGTNVSAVKGTVKCMEGFALIVCDTPMPRGWVKITYPLFCQAANVDRYRMHGTDVKDDPESRRPTLDVKIMPTP